LHMVFLSLKNRHFCQTPGRLSGLFCIKGKQCPKPHAMSAEEFRRAPFLKLLFPLTGGIILGSKLYGHPVNGWILPVCSGGILLASILCRGAFHRASPVTGILLMAAFFLMGMALGTGHEAAPVPRAFIVARVCEGPVSSGQGHRILVDRIRYLDGDRWKRVMGRASLYLAGSNGTPVAGKFAGLFPGCLIYVRCSLSPYPPPMNPEQFDYGAFQRGRGIFYQAWVDTSSWSPSGLSPRAGLRVRSQVLRHSLMEKLEERVPGESERDILNALLLGYRDGMDPQVEQNFAHSGTLHVLAVSGLHVGILYLLPAFLLKRLRSLRGEGSGGLAVVLGGLALVSGALWGYAFVTGLSSSVVRAVSMCCIHGAALISRRNVSPIHVVSLTAFLMILARPAAVFEAGFQLSFTAVTGILLMYRRLLALFPFPGIAGRWLSRMLSVSLAAQLATLPLTIFYFHQAAPVSVLANLVVIPLATLILYGGLLFFLFSGFHSAAAPLASLLGRAAGILEWFTHKAAGLPGGWIGGLSMVPLQVVLLYLSGLLVLLYLERRTARSMFLLLSALVLLFSATTVREFRILKQRGVYVFALQRETAILFVEGRHAALFRGFDTTYSEDMPYGMEAFLIRHRLYPPLQVPPRDTLRGPPGFICSPGSMESQCSMESHGSMGSPGPPGLYYRTIRSPGMDAACFDFRGKRILVIGRWDERYCRGFPSLDTDLVVLCNNPPANIPRMAELFKVSLFVADGSNRSSYARRTGTACREAGVEFYSTGTAGCFVYPIRTGQKKSKSFGKYDID
jgi:competence protein ComEC